MNNKVFFISLISILSLTSCGKTTTSDFLSPEESNSENTSVKEDISSVEELSSLEELSSEEVVSSEESISEPYVPTLKEPTTFYSFKTSDIVDCYNPGESFKINQWKNYLILDEKGRVYYTVANAGCGYGANNTFACVDYYRDSVLTNIQNGMFYVDEDYRAYSISYEAYGKFSSFISNGDINEKEFEDNGYGDVIKVWNSSSNPYITTDLGITFEEGEEKESITPRNNQTIRLSSISDIATSTGESIYKVKAPYTDTYTLSCSTSTAIELYSFNGNILKSGSTSVSLDLNKNEEVYLKIKSSANKSFSLICSLKNNTVELPYEINSSIDTSKLSTTSSSSVSPLKATNISYTKRSDDRAMYINSNNPEALSTSDVNKCLASNDISNKDVFFTFEHNNPSTSIYYGYRVTNTGNDDLYITVKNFGLQLSGAGTWLGEDEWIKFYNTKFNCNTSSLTSSQKANYNAYVGFANTYTSANRKPITYRIPKGKYIYVMGGTSADAYNNVNVFSSANKTVKNGCSNGAVLFSTNGSQAKGEFVVYNDVTKLNSSISTSSQQGYVGDSTYGSQYIGYDNCHGVVDADLCWTFNDATSAGNLTGTYTNPYYISKASYKSGTRYSTIPSTYFETQKFTNADIWYTHINPNDVKGAVGTDMTKYITIDSVTKKAITIDYTKYDGKGNIANIGNWMVDYIDTITLVNQGNKSRTFTYSLKHTGVILAFVRNEKGEIESSVTPAYYAKVNKSDYGDEVSQYFTYSITIPAHSIKQFSVDYNLLANSYGCISHQAYLA